ncbi:MAG: hypothetical protein M5U09_29395 [Gammaproteobacteria bacterium]|nr:hypothetical protein [Gammaproteobacteria bacterium]
MPTRLEDHEVLAGGSADDFARVRRHHDLHFGTPLDHAAQVARESVLELRM